MRSPKLEVQFPQNKLEDPSQSPLRPPSPLSRRESNLRLQILTALGQLNQVQEGLRIRQKALMARLKQIPDHN